MTEKVLVVDVGMGNLTSVAKALETAGDRQVEVVRSSDPDAVRRASRVVVPGQGGFGELSRRFAGGLSQALREALTAGTPYLGICLGLQILFDASDEAPGAPGLGVLRGKNQRLTEDSGIKIPHMGYNQLRLTGSGHPFFRTGEWFYFVHSYHAVPEEPDVLRATVEHGPNQVTAVVARENLLATQFHPEKSQAAGLSLLRRFLRG